MTGALDGLDALDALTLAVRDYRNVIEPQASPVAERWRPAGRGLPDALLEPLGRFLEAGSRVD